MTAQSHIRLSTDEQQQLKDIIHQTKVAKHKRIHAQTPASLYKTFDPEESHRLSGKLEIVYTPKHGSWLNMAEIELNILSRQCLNRRIRDLATMKSEIEVWESQRNAVEGKMDWQFTTEDAQVKLKKLYPTIKRECCPRSTLLKTLSTQR